MVLSDRCPAEETATTTAARYSDSLFPFAHIPLAFNVSSAS